ncbi:hypothetical protein N7447_004645 [Penicillium robsamsonii]|uniref:uncharacterized protein n=1 Tax=Penicillium robsamsonii TaxID=1792511 RepID=UPI0025484BBF|nr:uncharacterized protein N7447_004645 [Penicillium robsamsonii]KAJ5827882.1 hypothetical protein N7447_004645 [Penicillium robsamsonii]
MAPGVIRVDVTADDSSCKIAWDHDLSVQSAPILSTQNGLVYGYTQSVGASLRGLYEWYALAFDWQIGKEVSGGAEGELTMMTVNLWLLDQIEFYIKA